MRARDFDLDGPDTVALYLRISQDRSGERLGVERQEKDCRDLARRLGFEVSGVYIDNDISATNGKVRPEFERMLSDKPDAIIAWHQDRLLRLTSDLERVIALDVPVHTVTAGTLDLSTPAGRAVARTVAAWSQYEGEQKATRQRAANVQRAERGHWQFSRRPYGYERANGVITIVEAEADVVREGYRRYIAGESLYAIAADWNARGIPTHDTNAAEGERTAWSMTRVRALLRNEHYAGIVTYRGKRIDAEPTWEPLIDQRTWDDYIATREGRTRPGSWSTATKHLLSGMLVCGVCGGRMLARPEYRRSGDGERRTQMTYQCTSNWCVSMLARDVEPYIEGLVLARLQDRRIIAALRQTPDIGPVQDELADLRERESVLVGLVTDGLLSRAAAREKARALQVKIEAAQKRLSAMRRKSPLTDIALARAVPTKWKRLGVLGQRRVIEELGLVVTINKGRPGRRPLGPDGHDMPDLRRVVLTWT
jgi:site-specific DNA recombinase